MVVAYLAGVMLSWVLSRFGRRSGTLCDIAALTRMPLRAVLMLFAASIAVKQTSDDGDSWRGWVDHTLLILLIAAVTWLATSLVRVVERACRSPSPAPSASATWSNSRTISGGAASRRSR